MFLYDLVIRIPTGICLLFYLGQSNMMGTEILDFFQDKQ